MNNKGQVLALFVVILPVLLIVAAIVIDLGLAGAKKNEFQNVARTVIKYGHNHRLDPLAIDKMEHLINVNEPNLNDHTIVVKDNTITVRLYQEIPSNFGQIIGIKKYDVMTETVGTLENGRLKIRDVK